MSLSSRAFLSLNLKKRETACSLEIQAKNFSVTETKASCNTLKLQFPRYLQWTWSATQPFLVSAVVNLYTYFEKGCRKKKVHVTIPKGNMGYDQYTVPDDCSCRTYFCCFPLALANIRPWPIVPILSNFFEKKRTQNHPQCLSGLSRTLFPTTFLEIAVYC